MIHRLQRMRRNFGTLPTIKRIGVYVLRESGSLRNIRYLREKPQGIPLPPTSLVRSVMGWRDYTRYLKTGELGFQSIQNLLMRNNIKIQGKILDWGCGCARVSRHWPKDQEVYGTDIDVLSIDWCKKHINQERYQVTDIKGPLPFSDALFDLCYGFSVITHLPSDLEEYWVSEIARVLKPGQYFAFSTHGEAFRKWLTPSDQEQFDLGKRVEWYADGAGSNDCATFHPARYLLHHVHPAFEFVDFIPQGALGNPVQDLWLWRKK